MASNVNFQVGIPRASTILILTFHVTDISFDFYIIFDFKHLFDNLTCLSLTLSLIKMKLLATFLNMDLEGGFGLKIYYKRIF